MKIFLTFILVFVAYFIFDVGYHIQNHFLGLLVKGVAGSLFMIAGSSFCKQE